jgi:hypothetical protein
MAKNPEPTHIFHVYRQDGTAVFLHPFRNTEKLHAVLTKSDIVGHYGQEPRIESLTLFRNELYRQIDQEVKVWMADSRFIPRFLLSALAFMVVYFLMSFIIRDPLPIFDELIVSFGVSILTYILLGRRDLQSEGALKRKIEMKNKVDGIVFTESDFTRSVERFLNEREEQSQEEVIDAIAGGEPPALTDGHEHESEQMLEYLEQLFSTSEYKQTQKRIKRLRRDGDDRSRTSLGKWIGKQKVDVPLLSVYWGLRDTVASGKK